jgi:ATP phosphoribosyltransferase regulatory subunit HisZ
VVNLILAGLKNIQIPNLLIDFCLPKFLHNLLKELEIESEELKEAIIYKNISQIKILGGKYADDLIKLTIPTSDIKELSAVLKNLPISNEAKQKVENLKQALILIRTNYPDFGTSIDIFGDSDFSYHDGIGFTIFDTNSSCTIARGGSYFISKIPAVGATVYINNLRKILVKN